MQISNIFPPTKLQGTIKEELTIDSFILRRKYILSNFHFEAL
jgi:hypothetical protein